MMRLSIKFADEISRIRPQHYTDFGFSRKGGNGGQTAAHGRYCNNIGPIPAIARTPPKVPRGIPTDPDTPPALPPIMGGQACAAITDLLNLRTGPGMEYRVITALPPGSIVALVGEKTDNWQHVATTAGDGWVLRFYIQPVQCPPPPATQDLPRSPERATAPRQLSSCQAQDQNPTCKSSPGAAP
jgi:hypothetical protein